MTTLDAAAVPRPGLRAQIREFFHAPEVPYGLALMRIGLSLVVLAVTAYRWPYSREIFSRDGAAISLWGTCGVVSPLEPTGELAVALHSVVLLALVTSCIGWCTRASLVIATSGYVYLNMLDTISSLNKSTAIAAHLLLLLCCSHCGSLWSVDSWLKRSRLARQGLIESPTEHGRFSAMPRRLAQIFVGVVYLGAAMTKFHTRGFFTGEELQSWLITDYHTPRILGSSLAMQPAILVVLAHVTVAFEILFLFLAWRGVGRVVMLTLGTLFHIMTCLTLGIFIFPLICICSYFVFLNETDIAKMWQRLAAWREQGTAARGAIGRVLRPRDLWVLPSISPWVCGVLFAGMALLTALGGTALEYKLDPYGVRRPEGPFALKELDRETAGELLSPTGPIRNEDKFFNFDVGSVVVAGAILNRRNVFYQDETVRVECGMMPPHGNLWLECNLLNTDNRALDNIGVFVPVDSLRMIFYYTLGNRLLPGDYSVVLKIAGEEVIRRPIKIIPRQKKGAVAN